MKKKTLGIIIVSVLGTAAIFCSAMFTHQYLDAKNSKSAFDDLTNLITEIDKPQKATEAEESGLNAEELAAAEAALAHEKYDALFEQNNDFIGCGRGRRGYLSCCLDRLLLLWYFLFKRGYRLRKDDAAGHSGNQHGLPERAGCHQGFR